jgi:hypothetical protein
MNFVFFDVPTLFKSSADRLAEALQTDIGWIRHYTDSGEVARRWAAASLLLRSPPLEEGEALHCVTAAQRDSGRACQRHFSTVDPSGLLGSRPSAACCAPTTTRPDKASPAENWVYLTSPECVICCFGGAEI